MRDSLSQQSTSCSSTSSLLRELSQALSDLDLVHERIRTVRHSLSRRSRRSSSPPLSVVSFDPPAPPPPAQPPVATLVSDPPLLPGGSIQAGDHVLITHPRPGQQSVGVARFARGQFIYVLTSNDALLRRYKKNPISPKSAPNG